MMKLRLIKGCPVNGRDIALKPRRVAYPVGEATRDQWFDSFPSVSYEVNTARLGESIRLKASIGELMGYTYGYIQYETGGTRYYFYVVDLAMITESQTEVRYNLDPYETIMSKSGTPEYTAHITNLSPNLVDDLSQVYVPDPVKWNAIGRHDVMYSQCFMLATGYSDNFNTEYVEGGEHTFTIMYQVKDEETLDNMLNGQWFKQLYTQVEGDLYNPIGILPSDIYYMAFIPCPIFTDLSNGSVGDDSDDWKRMGWRRLYTSLDHTTPSGWWALDQRSLPVNSAIAFPNMGTITSTPERRQSIVDARGTTVWECPVGSTYSRGNVSIEWNATTCSIVLNMTEVGETDPITVYVPCETVDLYSSSWAEYFYRQRESDKALRQTQLMTNLGKMAVGSMSSAGMGGAFSGKQGAASALGGDVVSALGGWLIDSASDPFIQRIMDRQAKNQADPLALAGSMTAYICRHNRFGIHTVQMDNGSLDTFRSRVAVEGYDIDRWTTGILDDAVINSREDVYIKGYFKFSGPAPRMWFAEIERRFSEGLTLMEYATAEVPPEGGAGAEPV